MAKEVSTSEDTKQRLLEAAGEVFASRGYEAATTREICQRAEANIAAVNYHFGDKHRLYVEAVRRAHCVRAEQVPLPDWSPDTPPAERLRAFIRNLLERMVFEERPAWHLELAMRELARPTDACVEVVNDFIRPMAEALEVILRELLPVEMSRAEVYLVGNSIVGQCLFYHQNRPIISLLMGQDAYDGLTVDFLASHISRFTLAALGFEQPLAVSASSTP